MSCFDSGSINNVKYASISQTSSGDLVAIVTSRKIRVVGLVLAASATLTVAFQSGGSTALTGAMTMIAGVPQVWPTSDGGYFQTIIGEKLNLVQTGAGTVAGCVAYQEV